MAPVPIRWGLGDFAWAWPATVVGQVVIGTFVVAARGAPRHYQADAIDIAVITAGSAVLTVLLLRTFVVNRGRGSLLADLGFTVRLVRLALARRRACCSRWSPSAWWR